MGCYVTCHVTTETTTPTTTYTTTTPTTTPTTTTPTTTPCNGFDCITTPTTTTTTYTTTTTPTEPTICPYGKPYRVCVRSIYANNYHPTKPVIAEVFSSAHEVPESLEVIQAKGDESPDMLQPKEIERRYSLRLNRWLSKLSSKKKP